MASVVFGKIDMKSYKLTADIDYLNSITKLPEAYDEFGQGYWKNLSIYNASGHAADSQYRSADQCKATEYARHCPEICRLLEDNFQQGQLKMVRARNLVDGMVIPHRDFVELDKSTHYFRVFIPLEYNNQSFHSDESGVFQMEPGEVWFLDAAINHAAINFGGNSRMSLCLDFMFEEPFAYTDIFSDNSVLTSHRNHFYIKRKTVSDDDRDAVIAATAKILNRHTFKDLLFALAKYHFSYDVPVASCYDWIISAAEAAQDKEVMAKAKALRRYLIEHRDMHERYTINDWAA